jgi:ABC-2 type transport system permease protein
MHQLTVFAGAFDYEFRMQIRRRSLWITMLLFILFLLSVFFGVSRGLDVLPRLMHFPILELVVYWTCVVNFVLPIAVGVMLADRLPRDRRTKVEELLTSTPGALGSRILGKYLGSTAATIVPVFIFYSLGIALIVYETHNVLAIPLALVTFAAIALPGLLFVAAYSVACPAVLWVPLYQFLFVGYWFWGNYPIRNIPSLSRTLLRPIGAYMSSGFFGYNLFGADNAYTPLQGVESLLLLLGCAALILMILWQFLKWQKARQ